MLQMLERSELADHLEQCALVAGPRRPDHQAGRHAGPLPRSAGAGKAAHGTGGPGKAPVGGAEAAGGAPVAGGAGTDEGAEAGGAAGPGKVGAALGAMGGGAVTVGCGAGAGGSGGAGD